MPLSLIRRRPVLLPLACAAAMALVVVSEGAYRRSVATLDALGQIGAARLRIQALAQGILDAESGQRGYLLTQRPEYLDPFARSMDHIRSSLTDLATYYGGVPRDAQALTELSKAVETKLSELAETLRLAVDGKSDAALQLMLSDIGREKMEVVRRLSGELLAREADKVARGREDIYRTLEFSRVGVALLSALALVALFMYLRQTLQLERERQAQQRSLQEERDRLELEVAHRTARLTELTDHLQTAREDERGRLARNLHDELGALLTSAKLDAARIRSRLGGAAPEASERLAHLVETLNSSIALGRRIIEDLRPSTLSNLGLVPTLEILSRDVAARADLAVHTALEPVSLEPDAELVVYRLVQEATTNISKYAQARNVWIDLGPAPPADGGPARVRVSVRDDGVGFDPQTQRASAFGLVGMRFRVEAEGGTLSLHSAPGAGTAIEVHLPAASAASAPEAAHPLAG